MKIIIIFICLIISVILWRKYIEFENYVDESLNYFDWKYYINNNPDISEDINSEEKAKNHYNTIGKFLKYTIFPIVFNNNKNNNKKYLSILAIFKNETMILETWIKHYIWQGVDHIYLIDNNSDDNPLDILQPYIDIGYITVYQLPGKYRQMTHFKYVYEKEKLQENTTWLMNIDIDEYYFCKDCDIKNNLKKYENYWVIYSKWRDFGSNGLKLQPKDPRLSFTTRRIKLNWQGKYIIQTKYINLEEFERNPHHLSNIDKNNKNKTINLSELFILNHYRIMSLEYFKKVKMARGSATQKIWDNLRSLDYFKKYDIDNTYVDTDLKILVLKNNRYTYLDIYVTGTIFNRINLILYYCIIFNKNNIKLRFNWVLNENCNEEFANLFDTIPNVEIITSHDIININHVFKDINKDNYKLIKPKQQLQKKINNIISLLQDTNIYIPQNKYIACNILNNDYDKYVNFINQYSDKLKIYIMTDNKEVIDYFINMYNTRLVYKKGDSGTIQNNIIDIYVCASATYFIGPDNEFDNEFNNLIKNLRFANKLD